VDALMEAERLFLPHRGGKNCRMDGTGEC